MQRSMATSLLFLCAFISTSSVGALKALRGQTEEEEPKLPTIFGTYEEPGPDAPSGIPSDFPSVMPSLTPSDMPSLAPSLAPSGVAPIPETLLYATFDSDSDGFSYTDDAFRGTSNPYFASGIYDSNGGTSGTGGLQIFLGGSDDEIIQGMSGAWSVEFTVSSDSQPVTLQFDYRVMFSSSYDEGDFSEVLCSIDDTLVGFEDGYDYVERFEGEEGENTVGITPWMTFRVELGSLSVGTHTVALGGYTNEKDDRSERTVFFFDNAWVGTP